MSRRRREEREKPEEKKWFEDEYKWEKEGEIDVEDLTQLPGVNKKLARKLKKLGYDTLHVIGYADVDSLIADAGVTKNVVEKMIRVANELVGNDE